MSEHFEESSSSEDHHHHSACKCLETVSVRDMREVLSKYRNSPGDIQTVTRRNTVLKFSDVSCGTVTANLPNNCEQIDFEICFIFSYSPLKGNPSTFVPPNCNNCRCIVDTCVISMRERLKLHKKNNQLLNVNSIGLNSITRVNVIEVREGVAVFKEPGAENVIFVSLSLIESLELTV
ncbi:hypothetical protein [Lysinibacillus sp. JNUCC 51]|uniref:hypothetical protein n=1 Tax=Lysinibacillus sp. JNUCC-51 TaxID=2792479 RepID=UPI00193664B7|nr:hypothetical protein JNUCC51_02005 [Lysinibacillus sp. JNUCC-51]